MYKMKKERDDNRIFFGLFFDLDRYEYGLLCGQGRLTILIVVLTWGFMEKDEVWVKFIIYCPGGTVLYVDATLYLIFSSIVHPKFAQWEIIVSLAIANRFKRNLRSSIGNLPDQSRNGTMRKVCLYFCLYA